jgi:hypothetical protein
MLLGESARKTAHGTRAVVVGAIAGVAGPAGGTVAAELGFGSTSLGAGAATFGINGLAGAGATAVDELISGQCLSGRDIALGAVLNGAAARVADLIQPSVGILTWSQAKYFAPRTLQAAFHFNNVNTRAMYVSGGFSFFGDLVQGFLS